MAAACTPGTKTQQLAAVEPVPTPTLPPWIASISPTVRARSLAQIRVIFAKPVTKVESLEGDGPADVLSHVRIDPQLKGRFVVLTPRMIGFVADQALPISTRVKVTLTAGLRDLDGDALASDLPWTFETDPLKFEGLPSTKVAQDEATPPPVNLRPALRITANAPVDVASLGDHATLSANGQTVEMEASPEPTPSRAPGDDAAQRFDSSQTPWVYTLRPRGDLQKATTYQLSIAPGVATVDGNVATERSFDGSVRTYGQLAIVPTPKPSPDSGGTRFAGGDPVVTFSNPIDASTIAANVSVSPAPANVKIVPYPNADEPSGFAVDPYTLDPDRAYTIAIAPGLKDMFGQTLGTAQTVSVHTSDFAAGAWAPSGYALIPAGAGVNVNFYATNLPGNRYRAAFAPVSPISILQQLDATKALPAKSAWPQKQIPGATVNKQSVVSVPLQAHLNAPYGALAYGFSTDLDRDSEYPTAAGVAQLTNLGVFAQWFPERGIVLAQHLDDGSPARAKIALYRMPSQDGGSPEACAQGETNAAGEFDLGGVDLERCYVGTSAESAPSLGVVVTEGADVATLATYDWSGVYRFGVPGGWVSGKPLSRGTVFPDRDLYQPGERAELTGIAYFVRGPSVVADRNASYSVALQDPSGKNTSIGKTMTDAYGVFTLALPFSKQQALGYYVVTATGANGNQITGSFRVAEFKPPNFKLALALDKTSATAGSQIGASAAATYLFGAPLQGGKAKEYVTRDLASITPKGWDDYWFGRQWFWPDQPPSFQTEVFTREASFDKDGRVAFPVSVASDLPFPMTYRVDVEASDVSNLSVADSKSFLALPVDATIGLASTTVGAAGSAMPIKVIVTDADGNAVGGRAVHLELQKMTYVSASRASEGGETADQSVKYDTVAQTDVTPATSPATASLTPPDAGSYRVRANFSGAKSDASETDLQVFAFGANEAEFGGPDKTSVTITLDKKKYKVGDVANAIVASPFAHADVYLAVVRHDAIYRTTLHNVAGVPNVTFKVTPEMLPNAAVEAVVVRRGSKLSAAMLNQPKGAPDSLARAGMAGFNVDVGDRYLKIGIAPASAQVAPGAQQRVNLSLTDIHGRATRGKIVVMAVNDAVLQLSGYRLPDLVKTVFADQPISTRFADSRDYVALQTQTPPVEKGFGYGGGFLEGAAGTRVRTQFSAIAYYGAVTTDAQGKATVAFTLPDDLTTWRVMAVAVGDDDAHFGTNDATFIATLPLMANPLLPQFARPGDRFDLGTSVMNQTGGAGSLDLTATLTGALAFAGNDPHSMKATQNATTGMQAFRYPVVVGTPAPSTVAFTTVLGQARDAFSVPLEIRNRAVTESVIESGASAKRVDVPVAFDRPGTLDVTVANSVVPQFALPADRAMTDESLDLTDTAASRLVIASSLGTLAPKYHLSLHFDAKKTIDANLHTLLGAQRGDGGFGAWPNAKSSDPYVSAYAIEALAFARRHGVAVDSQVLGRARTFASQTLANPERFTWCTNDDCKRQARFAMLAALADAGDRRTDFLSDIVAQGDSLDTATQIALARYLLATPGWKDQGSTLANRLQQTVYVTGRYAVANITSRWGWLGSLPQAQAQMLQLLLERNASAEQVDGAVRALVAQQCKCGWPTIDDTAAALRALDAYSAREKLVPMSVTVDSGSTALGTATFGAAAQSRTFAIPTDRVREGKVSIAPSAGTAHYTLLYTYDVAPDAPGQLTAFRVTREVRNVGDPAILASMDLASMKNPVELAAGHVFDVGIRFAADHPVDRVAIEDPLPAGLEAVDTSFQTSTQALIPQSDSWQIDDRQIFKDRVVGYAMHLGPGVYEMHYLVRSVTPGTFRWPGTLVYLTDAPEQFGRSAMASLDVK